MFCSLSPLQAERHTSDSERLAPWSHRVLVRAMRHGAGRLGHRTVPELTWCLSTHSCVLQSVARMWLNYAGCGRSQIAHSWLSHIKAVLLPITPHRVECLTRKATPNWEKEKKKKRRLHWLRSFLINLCSSSLCVPDIEGCLQQRKWKIGFIFYKCFILQISKKKKIWWRDSQSQRVSVKTNTHTEKHYFAFWDTKKVLAQFAFRQSSENEDVHRHEC